MFLAILVNVWPGQGLGMMAYGMTLAVVALAVAWAARRWIRACQAAVWGAGRMHLCSGFDRPFGGPMPFLTPAYDPHVQPTRRKKDKWDRRQDSGSS